MLASRQAAIGRLDFLRPAISVRPLHIGHGATRDGVQEAEIAGLVGDVPRHARDVFGAGASLAP